ncbi:MAG TPA: hypothetical protein ENG84_04215 [Gammaproteobacteria bacterium]|nr:hypothetical protein [Gammaproteobacteria bacterium]
MVRSHDLAALEAPVAETPEIDSGVRAARSVPEAARAAAALRRRERRADSPPGVHGGRKAVDSPAGLIV